jgi:hypothetical protein
LCEAHIESGRGLIGGAGRVTAGTSSMVFGSWPVIDEISLRGTPALDDPKQCLKLFQCDHSKPFYMRERDIII